MIEKYLLDFFYERRRFYWTKLAPDIKALYLQSFKFYQSIFHIIRNVSEHWSKQNMFTSEISVIM